ncbi:MAG: hypothetical protein ACI8UO_003272 [Verrucomicrobiales bacterium]
MAVEIKNAAKIAKTAWRKFLASPAWLRLLLGLVLWFFYGDMRNGVKYPAALLIVLCVPTGFVQLLFKMEGRRWWEWFSLPWSSPLTWLVAFVLTSLSVKEFFPLSNYPMYRDPDPQAEYMYLVRVEPEGEIEPLPSYSTLGISTSKIGKIYRSVLKERGIRKQDATAEDERKVGIEALKRYQKVATDNKIVPKPGDTWALMRTEILPDPEVGISEETTEIARRPIPPAAAEQ